MTKRKKAVKPNKEEARRVKVTPTTTKDPKTKEFFDSRTGKRLSRSNVLRRIRRHETKKKEERQVEFWTKGAVRANPDLSQADAEKRVKAAFKLAKKRQTNLSKEQARRLGLEPREITFSPIDRRAFFDRWFEVLADVPVDFAEEWRQIGT